MTSAMIKNLLFDLGGVIMDIRRENAVEALQQLGMADADSFLGEYSQQGPFEGLENGSLTIAGFHEAIRRIIGNPNLEGKKIDKAFGKFLLGIPMRRLGELEKLHEHYNIYMLSNTNPIMWADGIDKAFRQQGKDVDYYFDGIVRSYVAGVMKPAPGIFEYTITVLGIKPEETLFLDDSQRNLDAATAFGFHTLLVPPGSEFYELLRTYPHIRE